MTRIDYFFSAVSPYSYLAGTRLEEIAARHGASIAYKPLDLNALFDRTGGSRLDARHESRKAYRLQDLGRQAARLGLTINLRPAHWPTNPAPSAYAIIAATGAETGDLGALVHGLCRACWAEEKDIAEDSVIRDCLVAAGFAPELADKGLWTAAATYERNLEDAVEKGAFGAPFYVTGDGARFWGQDRLADLDLHLAGKL